VQAYARREPDATKLITELLAGAGVSIASLFADTLSEKLDAIERIDRLTTIAETRRNAALREIDRRRAMFGETVRRTVQQVEDAEFRAIEATSAQGKSAA
jgi:hypothetical protein